MKAEKGVKAEEEEEEKRAKAEVLDLTGEGDFVLPSRKIGEAIVVEDDSSSEVGA